MRTAFFLVVAICIAICAADEWPLVPPPGFDEKGGYFLSFFTNAAYIAFPILPWEIFILLPLLYAYFIEKPGDKLTNNRLLVGFTYWGGIYGGVVHTVAVLAVFSGLLTVNPGVNEQRGICTALPKPSADGPWCILMTIHALTAWPMGLWFLYKIYKEKKKYGSWFTWAGEKGEVKSSLYFRGGFFFTNLGVSGMTPYYGEMATIGGEIFNGKGAYSGTTWGTFWYDGRGYLEYLNYVVWFLMGLYFFAKFAMGTKPAAVGITSIA